MSSTQSGARGKLRRPDYSRRFLTFARDRVVRPLIHHVIMKVSSA